MLYCGASAIAFCLLPTATNNARLMLANNCTDDGGGLVLLTGAGHGDSVACWVSRILGTTGFWWVMDWVVLEQVEIYLEADRCWVSAGALGACCV